MTHILVDLETLGTRPGHVVLSAAFVRFSDEASCTLNLSIPDQEALGLTIDPETHAWWGTQPPEAWAAATANPTPLRTALEYFATWIEWAVAAGDRTIWCRGFMDTPMLQEVYRRAGVKCPWEHWQTESSRTMQKLAGVDERPFKVLPKHVALNDALGEVRASNAALAILAKAHAPGGNGGPIERRQIAEIAIGNAECAAQLNVASPVLRAALLDNITLAFT